MRTRGQEEPVEMGVKNPDGADYRATQAQTGFRPSPGGHGEVLYFVGQGRKNLEVGGLGTDQSGSGGQEGLVWAQVKQRVIAITQARSPDGSTFVPCKQMLSRRDTPKVGQ